MKSLSKISALANKFRAKLAQQVSAQPGDVENCLKAANLWDLSKDVSQLVAISGIPNEASIDIKILVSTGPLVSFSVATSPENPKPSEALVALLKKKFSATFATALQKAGLNAGDEPVSVDWLKF